LFQSAVIWSKIAENNRYSSADRSDLSRFLNLVRNAASSDDDWTQLRRLAPYGPWAKFSAFQILTQSRHNDVDHNMRLIMDDQSGTIRPVPWDVSGDWEADNFRIDLASHPLFALYRRNSEFLLAELKTLYHYTVKQPLLEDAREFIRDLRAEFSDSLQRDTGRLQSLPLNRALPLLYDPQSSLATHEAMRDVLAERQRRLREILLHQPDATWTSRGSTVDLIISGPVPLADLTIVLDSNLPPPKKLVLDTNGNRRIDDDDFDVPFRITDGRLHIGVTWLANRMLRPFKTAVLGRTPFTEWAQQIQPTRFSLVADRRMAVLSAHGRNALTGKVAALQQRVRAGGRPTRFNRPVTASRKPVAEIWRGEKRFSGNTVVDKPVRIEAGTNIILEPGANLVFRGKLTVAGTPDRPVRFSGGGDTPWGAVALQGSGSQGSRLRHLFMEGGSGGHVDGVAYSAMLSIHDTRDVVVSHLRMRRNYIYDDMLHVVYGRDIRLDHLDLGEARADAIDIDISDVVIRDSKISRSGNDCIDLMTSQALLERIALSNCGDKGVSVGEASTAALVNSTVRDSAIGVEAKDGSTVQVLHSDFSGNKVQINAYRKNWRYAAGGEVTVEKSHFSPPPGGNIMKASKRSRVVIYDSSLVGGAKTNKRVRITDNSDQRNDRRARSPDYAVDLLPFLKAVDLDRLRNRRGAAAR
jgi:hypothetical protein